MAQRVIKLLKGSKDKRFLFAFGTAHFIGKKSVIEFLRQAGYQVKRLLAPPKSKP